MAGVVVGVLVQISLCYLQDATTTSVATVVIPTVTVAALLLIQVADAIRTCLVGKQDRTKKLRHTLEDIHADVSAHHCEPRKGVRFITLG
jgi:hypothetical protein